MQGMCLIIISKLGAGVIVEILVCLMEIVLLIPGYIVTRWNCNWNLTSDQQAMNLRLDFIDTSACWSIQTGNLLADFWNTFGD